MQKTINSACFRKMIIASAKILDDNKSFVDSLNVFPVPDGDTGTNMSLTYNNVVKELNLCLENDFASITRAVITGALRGARGNSGVILSQILKGICNVIGTCEKEITTKVFAKALAEGSAIAYKAVAAPKEGTILTVIRVIAESAQRHCKKHSNFEPFFEAILNDGEAILQQTPEMLPVLKKAGVVDAGGRGLIIIFKGMEKVILGEEDLDLNIDQLISTQTMNNNDFYVNLDNLADIEFAYCTEFMITHMKKKTTESDIEKFREGLSQIGDSVVCFGDLELVKCHVHTNQPNLALGAALELGEIINIKIENMVEQNRELKRAQTAREQNLKEIGMVAVAPGQGIANVFADLLVDDMIEGGQTMNPSAEDIAKAVDRIPAKNVFVMPNNKNIILAAEQAKTLTKKIIHVIPTKSIPEGVASVLAFNPDATVEENMENMMNAKDSVVSGSVTYAVRTTHINGFDLKTGDIMGLDSKGIIAKGSLVKDTTIQLIDKLIKPDSVNMTLFYGKDVAEEDANALAEELEQRYPDCDINMISGEQPVYYYIISIE
ncbi:MAG: DAK2 domain-containing protein [Clostridia bacterium]|nr:DAK2 domain-containing protein [Clostridia bacterium]